MMNKRHALHNNTANARPIYGRIASGNTPANALATWLSTSLLPTDSQEDTHVANNALATWLSTSLLLLMMVLASCASTTSTGSPDPAASTPLTLPTGTTGTASSPTVPTAAATDWTTYHRDNTRAGAVPTAADPRSMTRIWSKQLDGAVYAEPLVIGTHVFIATEGDTLYSFDTQSGKEQWHTNVGQPVPKSAFPLPCGNIDPLGITGTPVYDARTGLIFMVAEVTGPQHLLFGIDANTGKVRVRRSVDPAGIIIGLHQQRAALALSQNMVYVSYGGLIGDCGDYHGWIVASRTDGSGTLLSYQVPTTREGAIWGASGPAIDTAGNVFVSVGNGEATGGNWDHTDSVLRLSPTLQLQDGFAPTTWAQDNAADADLGSMGPLLLPNGLVYANGKSGQGYLLHANALGGVGGQAAEASVCRAFGGAALLGSQIFVPCDDGIREVTVGSGPSLTVGWHAPGQIAGSPIVGGHTVYSLDTNGGTLYALDSSNGNTRVSIQVGQASRFATPTLSGNLIFVGTMQGVTAVKLA